MHLAVECGPYSQLMSVDHGDVGGQYVHGWDVWWDAPDALKGNWKAFWVTIAIR